jgi:hypothetical protein
VSGWLDREAATVLRCALDPLSAPSPDPGTGDRDPRSLSQRRADALTEVCRLALASGRLPGNGGDRPQVVVTVPYAALRRDVDPVLLDTSWTKTPPPPVDVGESRRTAGLSGPPGGAAFPAGPGCVPPRESAADAGPGAPSPQPAPGLVGTLDDGGRISAEAARRLACDAGILPAVLDGRGQVLDLGRQRRLFTGPVRRALVLRDRGCAFPGCDRPPRWCDGHHILHWADGGVTDLTNSVLLCGFHHRAVHHTDWRVRINQADGLPEFLAPVLLDPAQRPRRNTYHHVHHG